MEMIDEDSVRRVGAFVNEGGVLVTFGAGIRLIERYGFSLHTPCSA